MSHETNSGFNSESLVETVHRMCAIFGWQNSPNYPTVTILIEKFDGIGWVVNENSSGRLGVKILL